MNVDTSTKRKVGDAAGEEPDAKVRVLEDEEEKEN